MSSVNVSVDRASLEPIVRDIMESQQPKCSPGQLQSGDARKRIVVLQRGWVVIGMARQVGDELVVTNASTIRVWGTTKGLGEIAKSGVTSRTVLDPCGTVRAHTGAVVMQIDCEV